MAISNLSMNENVGERVGVFGERSTWGGRVM